MTSGVPQGSVLGPLAFVLYINDLPNVIQATMLFFADDAKIYTEITALYDQLELQNYNEKMDQWSQDWMLKFHPLKCKVMRLSSSNLEHFDYQRNNHSLEYTDSERDLGVIIVNRLTFEEHI